MTAYASRMAACILMLFAPLLSQYLATAFQHYGIGLMARIAVHVVLPVLLTAWLQRESLRAAFLRPLRVRDTNAFRRSIGMGLLVGALGIMLILGAFLVLRHLLDFDAIRASLLENFRVQPGVYPWIALAIVAVNPFLEEYFWRGFVHRSFRELATTRAQRVLFFVLSGVFFAVHHTVIIAGWFTLPLFLLATGFLAVVGMFFNRMYDQTDSILSSWIAHVMADMALVLFGFWMFGFFG